MPAPYPGRIKTAKVEIRLTPEQKEAIRRAAKARGIPMSAWVTELIERELRGVAASRTGG